jgi:hypothetical protein
LAEACPKCKGILIKGKHGCSDYKEAGYFFTLYLCRKNIRKPVLAIAKRIYGKLERF